MKDLSDIDLGFDNGLIYYVKLGSKQREVLDINA